jgi:hypothetical protein
MREAKSLPDKRCKNEGQTREDCPVGPASRRVVGQRHFEMTLSNLFQIRVSGHVGQPDRGFEFG